MLAFLGERGQGAMRTDEDLMLAAGGGDRSAFAEIVHRNHARAFKLAARIVGDRDEAADVVQEAFLKILSSAPRYRPSAAFGTYLYRVVANLCLDRRRKSKPEPESEIDETGSELQSPLESLAAKQKAAVVRRALESLPARQRLAVVLKYNEGLSYSEIAEVMDTSEKGVERLLARARESLLAGLAVIR